MYQAESAGVLFRTRTRTGARQRLDVSRNVVLLGLTSLLTDVSAEMVATVLPVYLVFALGASPLQFGIIEGLYQGGAALIRLASGVLADRWHRYKEIAALGYGVSAVCKLGLIAVGGSVGGVSGVVLADRFGKGIRTAPRDALISLSSLPERLGTSFGVHRAMDTAGAMLGPLIAFAVLLAAPGQFDAVFAVSLCFAILGLAVLLLFVQKRAARPESERTVRPGLRSAFALLRLAPYRMLVIIGALLSLVTISDAFIYLGIQRRMDLGLTTFPLLFVGSALAFMLLAIPAGRLADRVGRTRMFLVGYALLLVVYTALVVPELGVTALIGYLVLLGAYYAATDGVLMAAASAVLPEERRASGLGLLVGAVTLGKLAAAVLFGLLWTAAGLETATLAFGLALGLVLLATLILFARTPTEPAHV
jgi:MFS family permease